MAKKEDDSYRNIFGLTNKQEAFARQVLILGSYSKAYRVAYDAENMLDKTVHNKAYELSKHGEVGGRISELRNRAEKANDVTMDRIIRELARIAFQDITSIVDKDGLIDFSKLTDDQRATISGIKVSEVSTGDDSLIKIIEIKTNNKEFALDKLTKILGGYDKDNKQKGDIYVLPDDKPSWMK